MHEKGEYHLKKAIITTFCLCLMFFIFPCKYLQAAPNGNQPGNAVLLIIDRITVDDLLNANLKYLPKLAGTGAIGLMTTNPAGGASRIPDNTYTTIGSGFKVKGGNQAGYAFNVAEPFETGTAGEAYFRRTGRKPAAGSVVQLSIVDVLHENADLKYNYTIGAIGEALHRSGIKTAVIGNADIYKEVNRQAVNIAMDSRGIVDYGDVSGDSMVNDSERITGHVPDYRQWLKLFGNLKSKAGFIVIETGETSRLDKMGDITTEKALEEEKRKLLRELDGFIGELAGQLDLKRDLLMVVVPEPPFSAMDQQNFLTPIIAMGKGIEPGILWSGTVKRNGIVANTDIAPTVTSFFGIKPEQLGNDLIFNGQVISGRAAGTDFSGLAELNNRIVSTYIVRYPLVKGYINTVLVTLVICIVGLLLRKKFVRRLKPLLLALTAVPLAFLWQGLILPQPRLGSGIAVSLGLTLLFSVIGYITGGKKDLGPFIVIALLTAASLIADLLVGAPLNKTSPLSYDPMTGARFYGLGNEYMGVLIGALIFGLTGLAGVIRLSSGIVKTAITLVFVLALYVIAAPQLGTNVGGGIAAVAGFGTTILIIAGYKINRNTIIGLSVVILMALGILAGYDMNRNLEAQSHIGRTVGLIRESGPGELINIIARKAAMNWKLIKYTTWSWTFMVSLAGFFLCKYLLPVSRHELKTGYPYFDKGITGIISGAVAAMIFNDSGIVAAATMIVFGVAPYLSMIITGEEVSG